MVCRYSLKEKRCLFVSLIFYNASTRYFAKNVELFEYPPGLKLKHQTSSLFLTQTTIFLSFLFFANFLNEAFALTASTPLVPNLSSPHPTIWLPPPLFCWNLLKAFWLRVEFLNPGFTWLLCKVGCFVLHPSFNNLPPFFHDIQDLLSPLNFPPDNVTPLSLGVSYWKPFWKRNVTWQIKLIYSSFYFPLLPILLLFWSCIFYICFSSFNVNYFIF